MLRDGQRITIRAIDPADKQRLAQSFERLSQRSIYLRFLGPKKKLSPWELVYLTEIDFVSHVALVATVDHRGSERIVGVVRYVLQEGTRSAIPQGERPSLSAELALIVADEYQGRGIGGSLLREIIGLARGSGVKELQSLQLAENDRMLRLLDSCGLRLRRERDRGLLHVFLEL